MASQGVTAANSRLAQMQMRFQQKQQQEREQRRIEMTDESGNNVDEVAETKRITNGKVRQMFDDRRRGAGIDRANPLKPIAATSKVTTSVVRQAGGAVHNTLHTRNGNTTTVRTRVSPNVSGNTTQSRNPTKRMQNGNTEALTKEMSSLSLGLQSPVERNNNDVLGRVKSSNSLKLNPVVTKKSPSPAPPVAKGITNTTPAAPSTRVTPVSRPSSNSKTPKQRTAVISLKVGICFSSFLMRPLRFISKFQNFSLRLFISYFIFKLN
uniref:Uncharacterized protein n=1 Tax=Ceratitis capitata TaxID=7213 RepID=W8BPT6_CERCA